jgi:hypothetical protein
VAWPCQIKIDCFVIRSVKMRLVVPDPRVEGNSAAETICCCVRRRNPKRAIRGAKSKKIRGCRRGRRISTSLLGEEKLNNG